MFDPNLPQEGTPLDAVQMRSQLNGLKAIIDAILTVTAAQVDSTTTLPQGSPANASVAVVGNTLHFTFQIPQGQEGLIGPAGPPFSTAVVDSVTTLNPGDSATVGVSFDGTNVRFTFGITRGNDGSQGQPGNNGSDGSQGPPGDISQAQLDNAISGTSANTNGVGTLDTGFADPDMEALRQKLNEMILNRRR